MDTQFVCVFDTCTVQCILVLYSIRLVAIADTHVCVCVCNSYMYVCVTMQIHVG